MFDLTGKVAMVTGGGQGVGRGILRALAAQGATVAVNDYYADRAEKTAGEINSQGGKAVSMPFDVVDGSAVRASVESIQKQFGSLDILVNNAGVIPTGMVPTKFIDTSPDDWKPIVDINLYGSLNCTHAVVPGMIDKGVGRIITISSDAARVGHFGSSVYGAAKAGGEALMRTLAKELGPKGITANSIVLGLIDNVPEEFTAGAAKFYCARRLGTPEDIAAATVYLCSDEASWVTGESLVVNGGFLGA